MTVLTSLQKDRKLLDSLDRMKGLHQVTDAVLGMSSGAQGLFLNSTRDGDLDLKLAATSKGRDLIEIALFAKESGRVASEGTPLQMKWQFGKTFQVRDAKPAMFLVKYKFQGKPYTLLMILDAAHRNKK